MPETTPLIKAALNLRVGAGFDVYFYQNVKQDDVVGKSVKMHKNQRYFKYFLGIQSC